MLMLKHRLYIASKLPDMKILLLIAAFICPFFVAAQRNGPELKDSIELYRKKLSELWRSNIDSLRNSVTYKELTGNISRLRETTRNYQGFVLFGDLVHSDYFKFNQSIVTSGFTPLKPNLVRFGFGTSFKSGNRISDLYFAVVGTDNVSTKNKEKIKTSLSGIFQFDYGYDLTRANLISIYPFIGLSLRFSNLNYLKPAEANPNFSNISNILINDQSIFASSFRVGYQAGLGIDFKLPASSGNKSSTIFFTKFGINRPFTVDTYKVEGIRYKPEIRQGVWVMAIGFKFVSRQN